jgi:hypothetical protein
VADLPYEPPTCNDLSYKTGVGTAAVEPGAENAPPEAQSPAPAKPWWKFWE